jgi:hypothetical protein
MSNSPRGLGAGAAVFCHVSPAVPRAESCPAPDASAMRSPASAVVHTTAYRHTVTFAVLRLISALLSTWTEVFLPSPSMGEGKGGGETL